MIYCFDKNQHYDDNNLIQRINIISFAVRNAKFFLRIRANNIRQSVLSYKLCAIDFSARCLHLRKFMLKRKICIYTGEKSKVKTRFAMRLINFFSDYINEFIETSLILSNISRNSRLNIFKYHKRLLAKQLQNHVIKSGMNIRGHNCLIFKYIIGSKVVLFK